MIDAATGAAATADRRTTWWRDDASEPLRRNLALVGVLLVSSEVPEVLGLSDRVLVMREGRLIREAPAADLDESSVLDLVMAGSLLEGPDALDALNVVGDVPTNPGDDTAAVAERSGAAGETGSAEKTGEAA